MRAISVNLDFKVPTGKLVGAAVLLTTVMLGCAGCQTFTLTQEEWEKQQRGGMVDRDVGTAVGVIGAAGYLGATIAAAVGGIK